MRIVGGVVLSATFIGLTFLIREPLPQGGYHTGLVGIIVAALAASFAISTLIYTIAGAGGAARLDARLRRLWTGSIGKRIYNSIASRIRTRPAARAVSTEIGPLTVFEGLSKSMRRELGDVNRVIVSLVAAQSELIQRESRLESSQEEATRGPAGVATDTLERVITELTHARSAAVERRETIASELERLRLELTRLRSGVGTVAEEWPTKF